MKFKITIIGLLLIILAICSYTSYKLIKETKAQTELLMIIGAAETERSNYEIGSLSMETYQWGVWERGEKFAKIRNSYH